jgi:DNA-binding NtrC family response regulator
MQPKLLRAIESGTVRRLGENQYRKVDARFVSATHRDLRRMVNEGAFREDLYFRLAVMPIAVPPLRARAEDIPCLVEHFLREAGGVALSAEMLEELGGLPWLGNVRELRNFVVRAAALGAEEAMSLSEAGGTGVDAFPPIPSHRPFKEIREKWLAHLEREYIRTLLAQHDRDTAAVARAAGLDRAYVYRLMRKHDL